MELFDTHFHWYGKPEPQTIVDEAESSDVKYMLCSGWDSASSQNAAEFSEKFEGCWFSAGVHPHEASGFDFNFHPFKKLTSYKQCRAVGEVGLDYFYENSDRQTQLQVFEKFTEFALEVNKPLVIHCRDKENRNDTYIETFNVIKDFTKDNGKFGIHCYTGNGYWLEKFLDLGAYIGITGIITFPKAANLRDIINIIPDDKLLLETDSPYLAPKPYRGKTNFPKYLKYIASAVAKEKNNTVEKVAEVTTENAFNFFELNR
ncbi:MAG: TatD family hydrolase [Victivallales bacterium]|nr:TatD family hydrolase [Victivallales bacterium]